MISKIVFYFNSRIMISDYTLIKLIDEFKFKICEDEFGSGDFNFELFQYSLDKIFEEERKIEEQEEIRIEQSKPKVSWLEYIKKSHFMKYFSAGVMILSIGSIGAHYYLYSSSSIGSIFR